MPTFKNYDPISHHDIWAVSRSTHIFALTKLLRCKLVKCFDYILLDVMEIVKRIFRMCSLKVTFNIFYKKFYASYSRHTQNVYIELLSSGVFMWLNTPTFWSTEQGRLLSPSNYFNGILSANVLDTIDDI